MVFDTPIAATATSADSSASIAMRLPAGFHEQAPGQWGNATDDATYYVVIIGQLPTVHQLRAQYPCLPETIVIDPQ